MHISFIVPVHNSESTLYDCVKSITNQPFDDYEILLIENGSSDSSEEICKELCRLDSRIKLFKSETGVSAARNLGIEKSCGDYLCFVDSDDMLLDGFYSVFSQIQINEYDICTACADTTAGQDGDFVFYCGGEIKKLLCDFLTRPTKTLAAWAKLFSAEFVKKNNLLFDTELTHAEDSDFVISAFLKAEKAAVCTKAVYHYSISQNSAVRSGANLMQKYALAMEKSAERISGLGGEIENAFDLYVLDHILIILVHNIFKKQCGNLKSQFNEAKKLTRIPIFKKSLENADLSKTGAAKRLIFSNLKKGHLLIPYFAVKARQLQNKTKSR